MSLSNPDRANVARGTSGEVSPEILKPVRLVLPYPPSVNRMWRSVVPKGWKRAVVHLSDEGKSYKRECGWIAKSAGFRQPTERPVALTFTLHPPLVQLRRNRFMEQVEVACGTQLDLSNAMKVAEDALQGIVYANDRQVKRLEIEYGERRGHGELVVEIAEFVPAPAPAPLFAMAAV